MKLLMVSLGALSTAQAAVHYSTTFDHPDLAAVQTELTFLNPGNMAGGPQLDTGSDSLGGVIQQQSSWWQSQDDALFIYRTFDLATIGDFTATTSVTMRRSDNTANPIDSGYHYGGVMIMDPDTTPHPTISFLKIGLGYQSNAQPGVNSSAVITTSTTDNSPSILRSITASTDGEVRIERSGDTFTTSYRVSGASSWTTHTSITRTDLAALTDLRIGLFAYSFDISGGQTANAQFQNFSVTSIPEPSVSGLLTLGCLSLAFRRKRIPS